MARSFQQIAAEAMQLPLDDRTLLADQLWTSVQSVDSIAAAWDAEINLRMAQIDTGQVSMVPMEQVMDEIHLKIASHSI
jgi:putative addiction module component (TIGR02574 family)